MPTFDGEALTITLDSGVGGLLTIDAQEDLYEPWKNWLLANPVNRRFPYAFRTVGGDDLTPGIKAGGYFFIQNDKGWRIKFPEEDIEVTLTGNLAPEDSTISVFEPSDGAFKNTVLGLQPITQNVSDLLTAAQNAEYLGAVTINTILGTSGTEYPIGTPASPVDNINDAMVIAAALNVRSLRITGSISLIQTMQYWSIVGQGGVAAVNVNGQDVSGTEFDSCGIEGTFPTLSVRALITDSRIRPAGVQNFKGAIINTFWSGDVSLQAGDTVITNCEPDAFGTNRPKIDLQGNLAILTVNNWVGGLEINNLSNANAIVSINMGPGALRLSSTCSEGVAVCRGLTDFEDLSTGTTVIQTGLVDTHTLKDQSYFGEVFINTDTGVTGTAYPLGTPAHPVNNFDDAWTIAERVGVSSFHVIGSIALTKNAVRFAKIRGNYGSTTINVNGKDVSGTLFEDVGLEGTLPTLTHGLVLRRCLINGTGLLNFKGECFDSSFESNMTLVAGTHLFKNCSSHVPGTNRPYIDCQSNIVSISVRGWHGGLEIRNFSNISNSASFDFDAGSLRLDSTVTAGTIVVRGIIDFENLGTVQIVSLGLLDSREQHLANMLIAGRAVVDPDDLGVTIYDSDNITTLKTYTISADARERTPD